MEYHRTIQDFLKLGIYPNKIIESNQPCAIWSLTKKKLVSYPETYEVVYDENGNGRITIENNRMISVRSYDKLSEEDIKKINESEGIIVYPNGEHYRFDFIPTK